ncbi:hypothetical protein ACFVXE_35900 [Streptomyces sp. NPDC058231]|uniref:hypothetical protein n=1 Tax=Streptomyces sp. NPDC058231 TaxID=3346392 RepID=UPI0036E4D67C
MKRLRPAAVAVAVLATAVGAAGCNDTASSGAGKAVSDQLKADTSNWPAATPQQGLAKGLSLPLEEYMQTYEQTVVIAQAVRNLQSQCMARFGFDFRPPPAGNTPPPNDNDANIERRYGISDRTIAEKHGYGLGEPQQTGTRMPAISKAAMVVLSGRSSGEKNAKAATSYQGKDIPEGGCSKWAIDRIGAGDLDFSLAGKLNQESLIRSQESPEVSAALKKWSACMKEKGYTVDLPFNAVDLAPVEGSQKQIQVATADIDCKKSTDLVKIWFGQDAGLQRQQIDENQLALEEAKKKNDSAVKAAEKALRS